MLSYHVTSTTFVAAISIRKVCDMFEISAREMRKPMMRVYAERFAFYDMAMARSAMMNILTSIHRIKSGDAKSADISITMSTIYVMMRKMRICASGARYLSIEYMRASAFADVMPGDDDDEQIWR